MAFIESKHLYNLENRQSNNSICISANLFLTVNSTKIDNALFKFFNIHGDCGTEYAIFNRRNITILIESRSSYQKAHEKAIELDDDLAYKLNKSDCYTIDSVIDEIINVHYKEDNPWLVV